MKRYLLSMSNNGVTFTSLVNRTIKTIPLRLSSESFRVYSTMPGASIIDDLGEKESEVKMSSVALRSFV